MCKFIKGFTKVHDECIRPWSRLSCSSWTNSSSCDFVGFKVYSSVIYSIDIVFPSSNIRRIAYTVIFLKTVPWHSGWLHEDVSMDAHLLQCVETRWLIWLIPYLQPRIYNFTCVDKHQFSHLGKTFSRWKVLAEVQKRMCVVAVL